jgi:hypothetical protein
MSQLYPRFCLVPTRDLSYDKCVDMRSCIEEHTHLLKFLHVQIRSYHLESNKLITILSSTVQGFRA